MKFEKRFYGHQKNKQNICINPPFPETIKIEVYNACNYNCVFCPQSKQTGKIGCIDDELCKKIVREAYASGARKIGFTTTGEPLLNPKLCDYIKLAKEIGYSLTFINTNGWLLTRDKARALINSGIDSIKISVNAGNKDTYQLIHGVDGFERIINNIIIFDEERKALNANVELAISFVAIRQNVSEIEYLKNVLMPYIDDFIVFNANRRGGSISEIDEGLYIGNDKYSFEYPCSQLFSTMYVSAEGYVNICCQDFDNLAVVADLNEVSLEEAWNGDKFTSFRNKYLRHDLEGTLCKNCIENCNEEVVPLDKKRAYFQISDKKTLNLEKRIQELLVMGN